MATVTTYDPRCYELAEVFLADTLDLNTEAAKNSLALEIQQVIEDEIYFMRNHPALYPTLYSAFGFSKEKIEAARKECERFYAGRGK